MIIFKLILEADRESHGETGIYRSCDRKERERERELREENDFDKEVKHVEVRPSISITKPVNGPSQLDLNRVKLSDARERKGKLFF
jgi:hypothetical protein